MPFFISVDTFVLLTGLHRLLRARTHVLAVLWAMPAPGKRPPLPWQEADGSLRLSEPFRVWLVPATAFAACRSDSAQSTVSVRACTLVSVSRAPRGDAKRTQWRVNTAASAVSAAVRWQKRTLLPCPPPKNQLLLLPHAEADGSRCGVVAVEWYNTMSFKEIPRSH